MKFTKTISLLIASLLVFTSVAADASEAASKVKLEKNSLAKTQLSHVAELNIQISMNSINFEADSAQQAAKKIMRKESLNVNKDINIGLTTRLAD